ncbi:MAG: FAD:protein FMN transferase [Planctomycetota bacterium]|jgi:thiamine biosynthesis lipoprotein
MDKKRRIAIEIIVFTSLIVALYFFVSGDKSFWPKGRVEADSGHRLIMGTFAHIVAVATDSSTAENCVEAAFEQLESVDNLMSDYKVDSELSRVNQQAYESPVRVSEPLFEVLQQSLALSRETNGAFDITVGPLVDLFGSGEKSRAAPTEEQIAQARLKTGFQKLKLDEQNRTVKFAVEGMRLDLGGIAKGYAIDRAVEAMQKGGAIGGMVDVGGDIRCFGAPPRGKNKWLIGLQDPAVGPDTVIPAQAGIGTGKTLLVLKLTNAAIATSGDYRRFTLIEGKKYSHIIDTGTGYSSEGFAKSAIDADALATAVSVMGAEKGLALIETKPETEAILIPSMPKPVPNEVEGSQLIKTTGAESFIID